MTEEVTRLSKARHRNRDNSKEWSTREPCQPICERFSFPGSNQYTEKKTCFACGAVTLTPRGPAVPNVPEVLCNHLRTYHRGSTRTVHRVYCLDCRVYIYECPQEEHKEEKTRVYEGHICILHIVTCHRTSVGNPLGTYSVDGQAGRPAATQTT